MQLCIATGTNYISFFFSFRFTVFMWPSGSNRTKWKFRMVYFMFSKLLGANRCARVTETLERNVTIHVQ